MILTQKQKDINTIKSIIVDNTEEEFHVRIESDDGGTHYVAYLPEGTDTKRIRLNIEKTSISKDLIIKFVPEGYIGTFLR